MTEFVGRLVGSGELVRVEIAEQWIVSVRPAFARSDMWIAPGLVDLQVNGYSGHDVNAVNVTAAGIQQLVQAEWQVGVTAICPTVITADESQVHTSLRAIAEARATWPLVAASIPCAHVEGPHISSEDGPRGAHDARHIRPPDIEEYRRWQQSAAGGVGIVTVAPELPGAIDYIEHVVADGVVAAIGHTAASATDIRRAVEAGATLSTHLGNGAHAVLPRHPNYVWDQLAEDRLSASFIADGAHLHANTLTAMTRAKGVARSILVSDTVSLAGTAPGTFMTPVGGDVTATEDGRLLLGDTGLLAGASQPLSACVALAVRDAGVSWADAVTMASTNPARLLGLTGRGRVEVGADGHLTLFRLQDGAMDVAATVVAGEVVHQAPWFAA